MIDLLGHVAYALLFTGVLLLAKKRRVGWLFCAAGNVIWTVLGGFLGLTSIVVWDVLFLAQNFQGWRLWGRLPSDGIPDPRDPERT